MRIAVWSGDMSDSYLKTVTQLGADCIDFGSGVWFPGVVEQGYPDLDELLRIRKRIHSWGLEINRVTLPDLPDISAFNDEGDVEAAVRNAENALRVFDEAGVPIARQRVAGDTFNDRLYHFQAPHRGGYLSRADSLGLQREKPPMPSPDELENWWAYFCGIYERLVPIAEEGNIRLAVHPSDSPLPDTGLGGLGFHRVMDAFPSRSVGYLYCCGTRAQAGGSSLVIDEIHNYGRKGRIFMVHFRNVRGSLATSGAFEETLLDDGDMSMFKLMLELKKVGFNGCLNPDHYPQLEGDGDKSNQALAYSIGYIKALFAAMAVVS